MTTGTDLLPKSADIDLWTPEEKSVAQFIGFSAEVNVKDDDTGKWDKRTVVAPLGVRAAFLAAVERTQLDPVARQIYLLFLGGKWLIYVSIDGARVVAQRTGRYRGQTPTQWTDGVERPVPMVVNGRLVTDADGNPVMTQDVRWVDVWTSDEPPAAARVGVYMEGSDLPTYAVATYKAYAKLDRASKPQGQWGNPNQLGKVAEMLALRKAFPQDLSGLYAPEETETMDVEAEVVSGRDWAAEVAGVETEDEVRALYEELKTSGEWDKRLDAEFRARLAVVRAKVAEPETVTVEESK